jgi:glucuronoarabinoxylan endo-1,4-beta-xylanase
MARWPQSTEFVRKSAFGKRFQLHSVISAPTPMSRSTFNAVTSLSAHFTSALLLASTVVPGCIIRTQADVDAHAGREVLEEAEEEVGPAPAVLKEAQEEQAAPDLDAILVGPKVPVRVTVDPSARHQTLEGFGASVGWYHEQMVGDTDPNLYQILFPELGLDILRLRNRFEREGPEDPNLQHEVEIVRRATKALGHPPKILMSSWSPPASLKASGKEKCAGEETCTLKKEKGQFVYAKFADWWRRSIQHYRKLGVSPDFISMQNEPDFIPPFWEGCKFDPKETEQYPGYAKQLAVLNGELKKLKDPPKILAPETLGIHYGKIQAYTAEIDQDMIYGVAHHIYERGSDEVWDWRDPGPDSFNDEMRDAAAVTDKPIFQTEFNTDEDKQIDGGVETAWLIHNSLVHEGVAAWLYWELIWPDRRGLVTMKGKEPFRRDQYYSMRHYSGFTDPGYVRVGAETNQAEMLATAFVAPDASRLTLVLINTSPETAELELVLDAFAHTNKQIYRTIYRPGHSRQWETLDVAAPVVMPQNSQVTVVLEP